MPKRLAAAFAALLLLPASALSQAPPDPAAAMAAQREAMGRLSFMDGVWRGPAWALHPSGRREYVQTERVGPFLDGGVRMVEGRGYAPDGTVAFNALGVISWDPSAGRYRMQTWARGQSGSFPVELREGGVVVWETPAGPGAVIRHTATIRDGRWREVSERVVEGAAPQPLAGLDLVRIGDTNWPAGAPVPMR